MFFKLLIKIFLHPYEKTLDLINFIQFLLGRIKNKEKIFSLTKIKPIIANNKNKNIPKPNI